MHAVITAADTPGVPLGFAKDNPPLKGDKVRCIRDEIAAVAADSEEIAAHALSLIEVTYEDLPGLFSTADALADGAPAVHAARPGNVVDVIDYAHGDIERGERESDVVLEDRFEMQFVTHCCMGASAVIAAFDSRGNLTIHSQTQVPFLYRREIAPVVDVDPGRIPRHPADHRRRLRQPPRHLPVRADRGVPGAGRRGGRSRSPSTARRSSSPRPPASRSR